MASSLQSVHLFEGVGGFSLAAQRSGIAPALLCENDKYKQRILRRHFPHLPLISDVHDLNRDHLADIDPTRAVATGGFPCTDLSVAGRRAGLAGTKSGLFWQIVRILGEWPAAWFVLENVPGLLSSHRGRDMGIALTALVELGYSVAWRVLDAQYFGLAQRRKRVFLVGHLGSATHPAEILFEHESVCRDSAPSRAARQEVAGTLGGGSGNRGWSDDTDRMTFVPDISHPLLHNDNSHDTTMTTYVTEVAHTLTATGFDASEDGTGRGTPLVPVAMRGRAGGTELEYGRDGDPAFTIRTPAGGSSYPMIADNVGVRRLMPIECERLQGFPDNWTEGLSDSRRYMAMGDAVAVPVAEWIMRRIASVDQRLAVA